MKKLVNRINTTNFEGALVELLRDQSKVFYREMHNGSFMVMLHTAKGMQFCLVSDLTKDIPQDIDRMSGYINDSDRKGKWFEIKVEDPHAIVYDSLLVIRTNMYTNEVSTTLFNGYSVNRALLTHTNATAMYAKNLSDDEPKQVYSKGETNA